MKEALSYDDVLLVPAFSEIESRSQVDLTSYLDKDMRFETPIIASPMDTVSGAEMAIKLSQLGGVAVVHRYNAIEEQCKIVKTVKESGGRVGAAIGTTGDFLERLNALIFVGVDFICIDVAHGHHKLVHDAIKIIRAKYPFMHIMAGNVATAEGFAALQEWGADSIRVGVGGGCFLPGTAIKTNSGIKNIEDVTIGDKVLTHDATFRHVVNTLQFDRNEEIIVINGIQCTKNHEFYVIPKEVSHLVNEDNIHQYAKWIEAWELDKEKHLLIEFIMKFKLKEIETIETKHYAGQVYDLTVEQNHSYNVNGIVVHNSICSTRIQTGHGVPNLTAIMDCAAVAHRATLIADGGIKNAGDIVKALAAGADFVMLGSLLAGTDEAPGDIVAGMKAYRGMASREAQEQWRGKSSAPEGIATTVTYKGPVEPIFNDLVGNIKSGLSYSGATTISGLFNKAQFIRQTSAGQLESSTHILGRR